MDFDRIWENILLYEGESFRSKTGKHFYYTAHENYILINENNQIRISREAIETALSIEDPTPAKIEREGIWGKSYVFTLITDPRIVGE